MPMHLARFPRLFFAHLPTPLEPLQRLSENLGGPDVWVKRDDCTGLGTGGNKTRKLEFLMAEALEQGADTVITQGATQSNHCRQTAAAAARLGLECHLLIEHSVDNATSAYRTSGNVMLDELFGAQLHKFEAGADMGAALKDLIAKLQGKGRSPYFVPVGGSNATGALGYANCALELVGQANDMGLKIDRIVLATGSAGTQAGLVAGLKAMNANIPVLGVSVAAPADLMEPFVLAIAEETSDKLGAPGAVTATDIEVTDDYIGEGYGIPTQAMVDVITSAARLEGLIFDPVYSGKALAGLCDLIKKEKFGEDETIVFLHTGGSAGLFGYADTLSFEI